MSVPRTARMSGISASSFRVAASALEPQSSQSAAETVLELAVVARGHGVVTLDRLLPDVGLDGAEILDHPREISVKTSAVPFVAELVGLIDGVTGTLTIGGQHRRERVDVVLSCLPFPTCKRSQGYFSVSRPRGAARASSGFEEPRRCTGVAAAPLQGAS